LRPSEGGVYGPGVYFYGAPAWHSARHYAERDGGVIVAVAAPEHVDYHRIERASLIPGAVERGDVAVVRDPQHIRIIGVIPTDETLDAARYERAFQRLAKRAPKFC